MAPNLYLANIGIRVLRRGDGSGPGIDLHQTGIESVVFQLFLRAEGEGCDFAVFG